MEERHQIFVVALMRLSDTVSRYRCVAVFHHDCLHGCLPLAACAHFITLVRNEENALIIEAELAAIESEFARSGCLPLTPAPFISAMLYMALSIRMEDRYCNDSPPFPLHAIASTPGIGDNDDGLTIIDITDLSSPAYCFVSLRGLEAAKVRVPLSIPLTAETYVRAYYPLPPEKNFSSVEEREVIDEVQQDVEKHIGLFRGVRLIEPWVLYSTWPSVGYFKEQPNPQVTESTDTGPGIPPLTELCLQDAAEHATSEDIAAIEAAISFPGVGVRLLKVLAKREWYLSDAMASVMITALSEHPERDQSMLDLSPYPLREWQVIHVASHFPKIQVLNLNNNQYISGATLTKLLPSLPELTRLIIYNWADISATEVHTLHFSGSFPNLLAVYHRGYMGDGYMGMVPGGEVYKVGTNTDLASNRTSFTFALGMRMRSDPDVDVIIGTSVPFLSPRAVVVSMCDIFDYLSWRPEPEYPRRDKINIRACFASLPRAPNVPFAERAIGNVPGGIVLCADGWMFLITLSHIEDSPREHGFVKYKFSESSVGQPEQKLSPPEVEVTDLAGWLEALNATDKVEKEWVERLSGYLEKGSLITKEGARERLANMIDK